MALILQRKKTDEELANAGSLGKKIMKNSSTYISRKKQNFVQLSTSYICCLGQNDIWYKMTYEPKACYLRPEALESFLGNQMKTC